MTDRPIIFSAAMVRALLDGRKTQTRRLATWRRADNTYIVLNASEMAAVGMAAGQHVATCYAACFAIKDAITGAASLDAVRAIDLNAGYPA